MAQVMAARNLKVAESTDPPKLKDTHVRSVALKAFEAVNGHRSFEQLSRFATPGAIHALQVRHSLRLERNMLELKESRVVPIPGRVTASVLNPRKISCVVVLHTTSFSQALTLTFEYDESCWRATQLETV